jgi:hypothetical protein
MSQGSEPHRVEKPDTHSEPPPEVPLEESAATLITVTPPDAIPPVVTPRKPQASPVRESTPKSDKKKKTKSEQIAERHAKRTKQADGQKPSKNGKPAKASDKVRSGAPKVTPEAPGSNGKIVLFVRYPARSYISNQSC